MFSGGVLTSGREFEPARKSDGEGLKRTLTLGEEALAKTIFGHYIDYSKVIIHKGSYFPFGLQNRSTAMSPNGEMYFRGGNYSHDFSVDEKYKRHLFIHEMAHVWQYQSGVWVKLRGSISWAVDYRYDFKGKIRLSEYSMEQQASIVADYFYLKSYGENEWLKLGGRNYKGITLNNIKSYYDLILTDFPNF